MKKQTALALLGGTAATASQLLDCTPQAVHQWPDQLPRSIADRVLAARLRHEWADEIKLIDRDKSVIHEIICDALEL